MQCNFDLEKDIQNDEYIINKIKKSDSYAQNLYAALCNTTWQKIEFLNILEGNNWDCSWRHSAGIVAVIRNPIIGKYTDYYCSGIPADVSLRCGDHFNYVSEGCITPEIKSDLKSIGWKQIEFDDNDNI